MVAITPTQTVPFTVWEDGSIRITGSRVTLDAIVSQFKLGATAEQIREDFPSLKLRDIYGALYYYLDHREEIEAYLEKRQEAATETCRFIESKQDHSELIEQLRQRRRERENL
jgi:uncharacterized protein (DUF433 family)